MLTFYNGHFSILTKRFCLFYFISLIPYPLIGISSLEVLPAAPEDGRDDETII